MTFGHLRFQEHLAAVEISMNRGIDMVTLMRSDWWGGVFRLFAQMSHDTRTIVEKLRGTGRLTSVADTVRIMAEAANDLDVQDVEQIIEVNEMLEASPDFQDY